jgi:succinoglycan biosynthesis transport protein ExoP
MNGANLQLMIAALRARFGIFAAILGITVLVTTVVSLLMPKTYKATVSLLADVKEEQQSLSAGNPLIATREAVPYLQTQTDVITSERVARMVAQDLKLSQNPKLVEKYVDERGSNMDGFNDWIAAQLLERLKVETSQSSVIRVNYSASDPVVAARVANGFAKAYIDTTLELRVEPARQAGAWFDEQLKGLRANLEDAQGKLTDYHRQRGIVSADERFDVENMRLSELSVQLAKVQDITLDMGSREAQAKSLMSSGVAVEKLPEVIANPLIQKIKTDLVLSETKLREMAAQYGPNYPPYQRQQAEVSSLRGQLSSEMRTIVAGIENSARQSREREVQLRRALAEQRARVLALKEDRNDMTVLTRNVESAQRAYDTAMQRAVNSKVDSRASQPSVNVLSPALVPAKPFRPRILLNIGAAALLGTILGLGIVMLMEMADRRVRSRDDLAFDSLPMLGTLRTWQPVGGPLLSNLTAARRTLPAPG